MSREITNKLYELIEEGVLDKDLVIRACFNYMSEQDVADMAHANEFIDEPEDEECEDHWHCDPDLASHTCVADRSSNCPTCDELPQDDEEDDDPDLWLTHNEDL